MNTFHEVGLKRVVEIRYLLLGRFQMFFLNMRNKMVYEMIYDR